MPFTQENKKNLRKCWGCSENCTLGFVEQNTINALNTAIKIYVPTINGVKITEFLDENGITKQCDSRRAEDAMLLVRKIARLCDNYHTKTK